MRLPGWAVPLTNRQVYERASLDEENLLVAAAKELVWTARKPPGWTTRENRGRPRKHGRGRPEVFHWRAAAVVLLLQQYLGLDYRGMAAHLAARPELRRRLELERAPRKSTIHRAHGRLSEPWLRERNDEVTARFKKSVADGAGGTSPSTPPGSRRAAGATGTPSARDG